MKSLYYLCTSKLNTIKYDLPELHVHDDLLLCQVVLFFFFYTYIPALFFIKCHHPKSRPQSNFNLPIRHICVQTNNIFSHFPLTMLPISPKLRPFLTDSRVEFVTNCSLKWRGSTPLSSYSAHALDSQEKQGALQQ